MSEAMRWDLSQLVKSTEPDWIVKRLEEAVQQAGRWRERYQGKIVSLDPKGVLELLEEKDKFSLDIEGVLSYCSLRYSADTTDLVSQQLHNAARKAGTKIGQQMAFMDIEMGRLLASKPEIIVDPVLNEYKHYLERTLRAIPHLLSETEERLVMAKDQNGVQAWSQLQGDWLSTRTFKMTVDGKERILPYGEIISYYQNPDRTLRKQANQVVYENLGKDEIVWSSAIRAICSDHLHMCEWRKYPSPMTQSLIANDLDQGAIDALMRTMMNNVDLYRRYLRLKAKLMKLPKLGNWDVIAPLPSTPNKVYSWDESRTLVVSAYSHFDQQFAEYVDEMYRRRHIDAEVRKGKESGAFCSTWLGGKSAFILQSFNGTINDVYTQAHELGHGVHAYLGSRAQKPSNYEIGSCIAECGSIFGELLLTEKLLKAAKTDEEKQAVLATIMDEFGMAAFQVTARYFFERSMYDNIQGGKFLDGETVSRLWVAARDSVYGDAMEWLPEMKWEWTMKMHYYIPNYRFYNYPYVFAQLFVFSLYRLYKEEGESFVPKLRRLLSAGSSRSPAELAKEIGFDIYTDEFWQKGMEQAKDFVDQLERTF
jgi:oligoendopeptidase F